MDIELKELSNIYLQNLQEEDDGAGEGQNPQQSVDVGSTPKLHQISGPVGTMFPFKSVQ